MQQNFIERKARERSTQEKSEVISVRGGRGVGLQRSGESRTRCSSYVVRLAAFTMAGALCVLIISLKMTRLKWTMREPMMRVS